MLALPVFPGAVGFGSDALAGRGPGGGVVPEIREVTTLEDDLPPNVPVGSLRAAVEGTSSSNWSSQPPRYVIFKVSGVIKLKRYLRIRSPYCTIAGQTAPAPGITIEGDGIDAATPHILIQHIKFRSGSATDRPDLTSVNYRNSLYVRSSQDSQYPLEHDVHHIVIDRCSISWGTDQNVTINGLGAWGGPGHIHDATISNCLISEALYSAGQVTGHQSYGPTLAYNVRKISLLNNVMAYHAARVPLFRDNATDFQGVNNFIFGTGYAVGHRFYFGTKGLADVNLLATVRSNVVHMFPWHTDSRSFYVHPDAPTNVTIYENNNAVYYTGTSTWHQTTAGAPWTNWSQVWALGKTITQATTQDSVFNNGVTQLSGGSALENAVLPKAGAWAAQRDVVDARVVANITSRQYVINPGNPPDGSNSTEGFINHPSNVNGNGCHPIGHLDAGYPTARVDIPITYTLPINPHADDNTAGYVAGNGYTNIEEWLHRRAAAVENAPDQVVPIVDDFEDNNATGWFPTGGNWSVITDGSKAYHQDNNAVDAFAILDAANGIDYSIQARVKMDPNLADPSNALASLYARFTTAGSLNTYYTFMIQTETNTVAIKKRTLTSNGTSTTVTQLGATVNFASAPNTWYTLRFDVVGGTLKGYVDGNLLLTRTDHTLQHGKAGVSTYKAKANFDDIHFRSPGVIQVADDFQDGVANGWTPTGSTWSVVTDSGSNKVYKRTTSTGLANAVLTSISGTNESVELDAKAHGFTGSGSFGVMARYTSSANYYYLGLYNDNTIRLVKQVAGSAQPIQTARFNHSIGTWYRLKLTVVGSLLSGYVEGQDGKFQLLVQANDTTHTSTGQVGPSMFNASASFDDVIVTTP